MRRWLLGAGLLVVLAAGLGGGFALYRLEQGEDVRGSSTEEFVETDVPAAKPSWGGEVLWPTFGYDERRLRSPAGLTLRPPYRRLWIFRAQSLLEFPPAIAYGRLYFANNAGVLFAINAETGKRAWKRPSGRCVAASPAVAGLRLFQVYMNRPPCNAEGGNLDGELVAYSPGSGKALWRKRIGPTESSPLVADRRVYVGDWRGYVYAFDTKTGRLRWRFKTGGEVKGAVAHAGKRLFVGSYDSNVYALDARNGRLVWRSGAQARLGPRGRFYSTPAVAYGRVYIGGTDGKVYSFGAGTGKLRWSHDTGNYVYGSPAVWNGRVLIGSYSGELLALDAATGDVRWRFRANGRISGSPTVLNGVVYFATLERRTYALDARTGRQLWSFPDGKYSPVVADPERLYLVGYARVYGMASSRPR